MSTSVQPIRCGSEKRPSLFGAAGRALPPVAFAALFAAWGMRNINTSEFAQPDAARHAMNGVLVRDWIAQGSLLHPVLFAHQFYSHFPSISIPYHPPLFPAAESLFYLTAGVHMWSARLAIAVATFCAALLLYRLVLATHGSRAFALLCAATTFSIPEFQVQASDVMLEMPALVFALAALWFLRHTAEPLTLRDSLGFALFAAAAVWTKQHSIFLAATPFAVVALRRKWREFRRPPLWVSSLSVGGAAAALAALTISVAVVGNRQWGAFQPATIFRNLLWYGRSLLVTHSIIPGLILGLVPLALLARAVRGKEPARNHLYLAWGLSAALLVLLLPFVDSRYLFNTYPPAVVLTYDAFGRLLPTAFLRRLAAAAAICILVPLWATPPNYTHGPKEAAAFVMAAHPARIIYFGGNKGGNFIFAVRELDPSLKTMVLRGDKLPADLFQPAAFDKFAREYGISYLVLESRREARPWDSLTLHPADSMRLAGTIPLSSSEIVDNGWLYIYRFLSPSPHPKNTWQVDSDMVRTGIQIEY